jgi:pimeloyl-ACP methyl ester carboxylesterase
MGIRRVLLQSGELAVALLLAGFAPEARGVEPLAEVIASVPNRINPWAAEANPLPPMERLLGVDQQFWVKVGPPDASLSVSVVEKTYQDSLDEARRIAHYDPDEADAVKAIQRTSAPVLIMHGMNDWVVPHEQSERLHAAALDHSELVLVPHLGHVTMWIDPGGHVAERARDWFDRWIGGAGKL